MGQLQGGSDGLFISISTYAELLRPYAKQELPVTERAAGWGVDYLGSLASAFSLAPSCLSILGCWECTQGKAVPPG